MLRLLSAVSKRREPRQPDDDARDPRQRRNPIARNEGFACLDCGVNVPPTEHGKPRNHCPHCLASQHVDEVVPGDRLASCRGIMDAIRYEMASGGVLVIVHRCRVCAVERRVRAVVPPEPFPDRWEILDEQR